MNLRASFLLTLPALALLAAGCATSTPGAARSTEADDVYFSSTDRLAPRYQAPAPAPAPAPDPTAPPAPDGSVANPDYTGQPTGGAGTANQSYYNADNAYAASPRVTSPYYGAFNQYNSGYAYDPFWSGSSLAIGCGYGGYGGGGGWGYAPMAYVPVYAGPRVRFGVSFGYGWGYSSWAAPMYGWAGPTFYDPFYDPFWGPSYGYGYGGGWGGGYGYGWGYPAYGYGGGGWRNGYRQGFNDGHYAGGGSYRNGRNVTYGPRLDRSAGRSATTGGGRASRTSRDDAGGNRTVAPGAGGSQPAYSNDYAGSSGYGGGAARRTGGATRVAASATPAAAASPAAQPYTAPAGRTGATRVSGGAGYQPMSQPTAPVYQAAGATRAPEQAATMRSPEQKYQQSAVQPQVLPQAAPQPARREGFFQRAARAVSESEKPSRTEASSGRGYSTPSSSSGGGNGGGTRSGGGGGSGGGNSGGARRTR